MEYVAIPILGEDLTRVNALRRLYFEAFTLMTANMRTQVERTDDDRPRKLSLPEREARRKQIQPKLQGLDLENAHEVSHALVDTCTHMREGRAIKHIPWEACTSRAEDIAGTKSKSEWKADAQGVVREVRGESSARTKAHSDLQLYNLFVRRGIACEMGGVMSFTTHQQLSTRLLTDLNEPPPPGYERITYTQIRAADLKAWQLLSRATQDGIADVGNGRTNVDDAMAAVLADVRFTMLLLPKQAAVRGAEEGPPRKRRAKGKCKDYDKHEDQPWYQPAKAPEGGKGGKGKKGKKAAGEKAKGGKGKKGKRGPTMPAELVGGVAFTDNNEAICFSYNCAAGCTRAADSGVCQRGEHVCCAPGCGQAHSWSAGVCGGA